MRASVLHWTTVKRKVNALAGYLGSTFTYVYGGDVEALPDPTQLANAMAYLSFTQSIDTLVTPLVDTNWVDPTKGYRMFVDQNTAYMRYSCFILNNHKRLLMHT
ncbi:hypothetical protein COOONC_07569 [Cooperia oncophora]